ncbi:SH3 domain containing GRB2 like 2a, endophilin A1 isoform X1 [Dunckerocampus dactyliophorus]|uniref:SH3 domain containing GRB2 like 2a, endophilin A1 isoform X1 n=1 Tax=Dunckerocampus dactyliophorus TaxID=161453 RepID=UPI002406A220|nr:SH3 domain containing GRB2 like 2a, endophilin A1 isoform X1 [Dunckerocampus dactyliophorus]
MSVAGLKKQFHKATQKVSEKVGGAEGTKLDEDFTEMEKKVDTTTRAVMDIMTKTTEYLQPNPATRAKMSMMNSMSRIRGQEKGPGYTQTEAILGESMQRFGRELGEESNFGLALIDAGESMRELAEVKDALDMEVKQNFIDPLQNLHEKDLKEIQHHLKKMEGRRLDFDYKKKRQGKVTDDEIKQALEKFDESKDIAELSMFNLLESDIEQVSQLAALVHAQVEYHTRAAEILTQLCSKIDERIKDCSNKPRKEYIPKPRTHLDFSISENHNGGIHSARSPGARSPARSPGETIYQHLLHHHHPFVCFWLKSVSFLDIHYLPILVHLQMFLLNQQGFVSPLFFFPLHSKISSSQITSPHGPAILPCAL